MLKIILSTKNVLVSFEKLISAFSLVLILLFTLIQLIARNFFESGFPVLDVISRHLVLFILFMGAALVFESNRHIKIDVLSSFLSTNFKNLLTKPLLLLTSLICFIFSWHAYVFLSDELKYAGTNELLSAYLSIILPAGFVILGFHSLLLTITGCSELSKSENSP